MKLQPILERELAVAARLAATYRNRIVTPIALAGLGFTKVFLNATRGSPALAGPELFRTFAFLTVAFCAVEGVRKTADCLSQERREGTLGLLFLTDLRGGDIVIGKLMAASLTSFYALFAMLPILGWSMFLGGVTPGEVWRVGLSATSLLLFSLCAGIWVSARCRSASSAMLGTFSLMVAVTVLPQFTRLPWLMALSPASAFLNSESSKYTAHATVYFASLLIAPTLSWVMLSNAAVVITHFRDADGAAEEASRERLLKPANILRRNKLRTLLLARNPICWLANRSRIPQFLPWLLVAITGLGVLVAIATPQNYLWAKTYNSGSSPAMTTAQKMEWDLLFFAMAMNALMKVLIALQSCRCLAEMRRNATLELLLCAPLQVTDILQGQIMALRRTFLRPLLALLAVESIILFCEISGHLGGMANRAAHREYLDALIFGEAGLVLFFAIDFQAVAWTGMWFGLCSCNESRATFKTVFFVVVLPHLMLILFCLGVGLFLAWPIASLVWARLKLQEHFRSLAGNRLTSSVEINGWVPFEIPSIPDDEPAPARRAA